MSEIEIEYLNESINSILYDIIVCDEHLYVIADYLYDNDYEGIKGYLYKNFNGYNLTTCKYNKLIGALSVMGEYLETTSVLNKGYTEYVKVYSKEKKRYSKCCNAETVFYPIRFFKYPDICTRCNRETRIYFKEIEVCSIVEKKKGNT